MEKSREEYNKAVKEVKALVVRGEEDGLVLALLAVAVRYERVNKLMRTLRKAGLDWSNVRWVELWFETAARFSLEGRVWFMDQGRLRNWIRKGHLDGHLPIMLELVKAHPEQIEFIEIVEKRINELSREMRRDRLEPV